jgi:hypothetical protein
MKMAIAFVIAVICELIVYNYLKTLGIGGIISALLMTAIPGTFVFYVLKFASD